MTVGNWFITPHAVQRYRERHRPDVSDAQALSELALWSDVAERHGSLRSGDEEWRSPSWFPRTIRFVVSRSLRTEGELPQLVTVLPGKRLGWIWATREVILIMESLIADRYRWTVGVDGLDRAWLADRRVRYAVSRRDRDTSYLVTTSRANRNAKRRRTEKRDEINALNRARHRLDRESRIADRICPECGSRVGMRKGSGVTPIYCSEKCNHRVASRNWWRRKRAGEAGGE